MRKELRNAEIHQDPGFRSCDVSGTGITLGARKFRILLRYSELYREPLCGKHLESFEGKQGGQELVCPVLHTDALCLTEA